MQKIDTLVIGSGMAGLSAAALWANAGRKVCVLEKNWLPGGCSSSYPRKHYIFESGATTLVGLDEGMPLHEVMRRTGIRVEARRLALPMQVHLADGTMITRYGDLQDWIAEAERVFGGRQREFWEMCYDINKAVWSISLEQNNFPPSNFWDLLAMAKHFRPYQLKYARYAFMSMAELLKKFQLDQNPRFLAFVDEQLLITAQNHHEEVNVLFGATALCYTLLGNYYVDGGLLNLVKPFVEYIEKKGGEVKLRQEVLSIEPQAKGYLIQTKEETYFCETLVSAIPLNDTLDLWKGEKLRKEKENRVLPSAKLWSAFTMGIVAKRKKAFETLHHQLHLVTPLPYCQSASIFVSLSHPEDKLRCGEDEFVANISTHIPDPEKTMIEDKTLVEEAIFEALSAHGILEKEDIIFYHSSTPKAWHKWTGRKWGFVGGYPQYMAIKPWNMQDARLDHKSAYICGDSTYPGQGIPGATLSGLIAFEKWKLDTGG